MKQFKSFLTQLLIITALMLPWATTEAQQTFEQAGGIYSIGSGKFVVNGQVYRIASGAKLHSSVASRKKFSDFKKGDEIYFKGKVLNGVNWVDLIIYYTPEPS